MSVALPALLLAALPQEDPFRAHLLAEAPARMEAHHVPGLAAAALRDGELAWFEGLGHADPVAEWRYSGGGYMVLQLLVEDVTGEAFAARARREVFAPLGMTRTGYGWTDALRAAAAVPHDRRGRPIGLEEFPGQAAAGLQTTARDLARLARASMAPFRDEAAREVLGDELLALAQQPTTTSPAFGHGYQVTAWEGPRVVGHAGGYHGWISGFLVAPETAATFPLDLDGDATDLELQRGVAPERLALDPDAWTVVRW